MTKKNMTTDDKKEKTTTTGQEKNEGTQSIRLAVWRLENDEKNRTIRKTLEPDFFLGFRSWKQRDNLVGRIVCDFHWEKVKKALETIDEVETEQEAYKRHFGPW